MSTMEQEASTNAVSFKHIDKAVKTFSIDKMEQENALLPDNLSGRVQKLVKVYSSIKPLLTVVAALPIIPATWRAALAIFTQAVEAVVSSPEISPDFKAGKAAVLGEVSDARISGFHRGIGAGMSAQGIERNTGNLGGEGV